jgi:hypothetical protein
MMVEALRLIEDLYARGHPNVAAKHPTTFEITKHSGLTKRGDCVLAVLASKGPADLSTKFKNLCRSEGARIIVELRAAGIVESIEGRGSLGLTLSHSSEFVGRKSTYVSDRTFMIRANKAASDIRRDLIHALRSPDTRLKIRMVAELG